MIASGIVQVIHCQLLIDKIKRMFLRNEFHTEPSLTFRLLLLLLLLLLFCFLLLYSLLQRQFDAKNVIFPEFTTGG